MKKLAFLMLLVGSCITIYAQTPTTQSPKADFNYNIDGQYSFVYNDNQHVVEFISSSNTFIEYDKNGTQITDGNFIIENETCYLTPIVTSNSSEIKIPVNFRVIKTVSKEYTIIINSSEVVDQKMLLHKL